MVTSIPRHDFPTEETAEAIAARAQSTNRVIARLEGSEMAGSRALSSTLTVAKSYCATDPEATKFETWEAWVTAMQVGSALFAAGTALEGPVPSRIGVDGEVKNLPATGPKPYLHAGAWLTSFYLAVICRENQRLEQLAQVPVSFLRASGAVFDEFIYDWVEALQSFWAGRAEDMWNKLVAAAKGTAPETIGNTDTELVLKILYPPINLFDRYQRVDTAQFNEALVDALTWHKQYWTADEARSLSSDGLVALAPLALACLARDGGFPIEVESEYLPKELLEFGWAGEVDA
ncbi:immunity 49 family protein [Streptomyces sp. NBC_01637]|uniref:immunity 49 family protein n=1 Tax=unclassified Streptomyces TaxID=2593676 RepID=UPI003864E34B|nr:immunity 49 family protein [Streptomyces sp. NBC_01653]WTD34950.1 immunity 49 family protein [Streptomyces sp. NBC_01643]WTD90355.1 immunity 49 family protein [Streptomyces sp. NBC_01637]